MNKIVKIVSVVALAASLCALSFAQGAGPKGGAPEQGQHKGNPDRHFGIVEKVLAQLDLNKGQKTQIQALIKKTRGEMKDLHKSATKGADGKPDAATRDKAKGIMKSFHDDLFKILNPDQQAKFKQLMRAEMQKMRGEGGGFQHGPRG